MGLAAWLLAAAEGCGLGSGRAFLETKGLKVAKILREIAHPTKGHKGSRVA